MGKQVKNVEYFYNYYRERENRLKITGIYNKEIKSQIRTYSYPNADQI